MAYKTNEDGNSCNGVYSTMQPLVNHLEGLSMSFVVKGSKKTGQLLFSCSIQPTTIRNLKRALFTGKSFAFSCSSMGRTIPIQNENAPGSVSGGCGP